MQREEGICMSSEPERRGSVRGRGGAMQEREQGSCVSRGGEASEGGGTAPK